MSCSVGNCSLSPPYQADPPFQGSSRQEPPKKRRRLNTISINDLPPEIRVEIFKRAAGGNRPEDSNTLRVIRSVCTTWYHESDDVLKMYWEQMRDGRFPALHFFANAINQKIGESEQSYFSRFCDLTQALRKTGATIPNNVQVLALQPLQYETTKQDLDASVKAMWIKIEPQINFGQDPKPIGAEQIRRWLNRPANQGRIDQITHLNLSGLELKIFPKELGRFTRLVHLDLSQNRLKRIPSMHCFTRLKMICLSRNPLISPLRIISQFPLGTKFIL